MLPYRIARLWQDEVQPSPTVLKWGKDASDVIGECLDCGRSFGAGKSDQDAGAGTGYAKADLMEPYIGMSGLPGKP